MGDSVPTAEAGSMGTWEEPPADKKFEYDYFEQQNPCREGDVFIQLRHEPAGSVQFLKPFSMSSVGHNHRITVVESHEVQVLRRAIVRKDASAAPWETVEVHTMK
jgi:hypothetical protein